MKNKASLTAVAAIALLCGAVAVDCSSSKRPGRPSGPDGVLSMALTLPTATVINSVQYTIHSAQPTSPPADEVGTIDTSNVQATPSVETSYPASTNDTVTLSATTADGEPCSGSSSQFSVVSNGQALVAVTLTCGLLVPDVLHPDASAGSVRVNGTIVDNSDICPVLASWTVSPLTTGTTGTIDLGATATDGNASDVLTYKWTASPAPAVDPFTDSTAAMTTFNCPGTGNFVLTITVDDHHVTQNCTTSRTINVACGLCGNGVIDPGEQCDSAAAFMNRTCDPNTCQNIEPCGNGVINVGEQCDSPAAFANNTCAPLAGAVIQTPSGPQSIAGCQSIPIVCGNGLVQPGEQCEPPNTATCDASCQTISACLICENAGSACLGTKVTATSPFGCAGLAAAAQASCNSLKLCLEQHPYCSNPMNVPPASTDPTACFCGPLDAATCAGTAPGSIPGVCADAYYAVYGVTEATATTANRDAVLGDFFNKSTSTGMANNLYSCDVSKGCFDPPALCP
jgi:hypothetical protein